MASIAWHTFVSLHQLSGRLQRYLEAGARWLARGKETTRVWMMVYNGNSKPSSPPRVIHKIRMATTRLSMDEVSEMYKITPIRRD